MRPPTDIRYRVDHRLNVADSDVGHDWRRRTAKLLGFRVSAIRIFAKAATINLPLPTSGAASRWMISACARIATRSSDGISPRKPAFGRSGAGSGSDWWSIHVEARQQIDPPSLVERLGAERVSSTQRLRSPGSERTARPNFRCGGLHPPTTLPFASVPGERFTPNCALRNVDASLVVNSICISLPGGILGSG